MASNQTASETSQFDIYLVEESTFGAVPGTARGIELRVSSSDLVHETTTAVSTEIHQQRDVDDLIKTGHSVSGSTPGQLSLDAGWLKVMELALSCDVGAGAFRVVGDTAFQVVAGSTKIVRAAGSWVEDLFEVGQVVRTRGFSNSGNNGFFLVTGVTSTDLTLGGGTGTLADEASASGSRVVVGCPGQHTVGVSVAAASSGNKFTRASGSFVSDGFRAGQYVRAHGFATAGNNATHKITSVSALELAVASTLATDSASSAVALVGCEFRNGTEHKSASLEQSHADVGTFHVFKGCRVNTFGVSLSAGAVAEVSLGWMGTEEEDSDSASFLDSTSKRSAKAKVLTGQLSVGAVEIDGAATAELVREVSFEVNNNLEMQSVISEAAPAAITYGDFSLTGKLVVLFKDLDLYNKFKSDTAISLLVPLTDALGDQLYISVPRLKFSGAARTVGGKNQVVIVDGTWQGLLSDDECTLRIHRVVV